MPIHIWWDMLLDNGVAVAWQLDFREINHWICEGVCLCYYGYQWQYHAIIRSLSGPISFERFELIGMLLRNIDFNANV